MNADGRADGKWRGRGAVLPARGAARCRTSGILAPRFPLSGGAASSRASRGFAKVPGKVCPNQATGAARNCLKKEVQP